VSSGSYAHDVDDIWCGCNDPRHFRFRNGGWLAPFAFARDLIDLHAPKRARSITAG